MASDFDERVDVLPVSDPNVFSQAQRIALAQTKLQLAQAAPEMHNMYEVLRDMYDALGVKDTDKILRRIPEDEQMPIDPAQENINSLDMMPLKAFEGQDHQAHIMAHMVFGSTPMVAAAPTISNSPKAYHGACKDRGVRAGNGAVPATGERATGSALERRTNAASGSVDGPAYARRS